MIARRCPECNTKWHSADTRAWKCGKCGAEITDETRVDLMEKEEDINGGKMALSPEEIEIIKTVQTKSYCERINCKAGTSCCGCPEQIKWEREVRDIKKSPLWEYAVEYNNYLDRVKEHKALEQKLKQSDEVITALREKLLELGILKGAELGCKKLEEE
jgi:uncharacterized Zn ribbon protein